MKIKTKYRLITKKDRGSISKYIQFFDDASDEWKFIPQELTGRVFGKCLTPKRCPKRFNQFSQLDGFYYLRCYVGLECKMKKFIKTYPNITKYFEELQAQHDKYLEEQAKLPKEGEIEYLN